MKTSKSFYEKAKGLMPGGVNSPVRAFEPYPFFTDHAEGSRLFDVDGNAYIDYCMAYGPLLLGHAPSEIVEAVRRQLGKGTMYGTPTEAEVELAELLVEVVPCVEMVRVVNSGTEATMHALRVARGCTGKDKIVKFEGCYHGAHDYVLVQAGSGATAFGAPTSLGVPKDSAKNTLVVPFNNLGALEEVVEKNQGEIAAVLMEPVVGNAGVILPRNGYLQAVRRLTEKNGIILIFDEVITGFRLALGGAQEYFQITPDMVTLGKIMGGGFPMAAFGGKKELMQLVSPVGKVYQAGTLSGNPISVVAGLTMLNILREKKTLIYSQLERQGDALRKGLSDLAEDRKVPVQVNGLASMFQVFFTPQPVFDYKAAQSSDKAKFQRYHRKLMERGVFIPPSQFETCFLSTAHSEEDVAETLEAADAAFQSLR
ncbi:glutamate-1-semialdehyde 2,1-aminomutase [Candidatus Hecatella orcuttiae]|jgi:glutamate-1-semialdehyde 2,1-aminomutase|uniref:glutamate-1-semialdehyde 2,1-aminomutase n=1 Tax=Candidatus Hecatella orcuttiae TaxID=1935119 RepID=UPI002868057D|nr:glutamate-1-semialdehyde 2,1-aminomutase [Candidatus Hecatella orcuttiae]